MNQAPTQEEKIHIVFYECFNAWRRILL